MVERGCCVGLNCFLLVYVLLGNIGKAGCLEIRYYFVVCTHKV
jgi:hypothetical protein